MAHDARAGSRRFTSAALSLWSIGYQAVCDESHTQGPFDGRETADRRPYRDRAQTQGHDDYVIADDGTLCVSAGFCGTRTTDVWKLLGGASTPENRERLRGMIGRCPSGRLVLRNTSGDTTDADVEPPLAPSIGIVPGGPLWVRGSIPVIGTDGSRWEARNRVTLCRCGQSKNQPFCDASHESAHFDER